jgi:mRNA interferase YafQ
LARELIILPRFKRDYRSARKHPEFESETLEYVFDTMISGGTLPEAFREHRLDKRSTNWAGMTECHLGADLLLIYRVRREAVIFHRIGTHEQLFVRKTPSRGRAPRRPK